MASEKVVKILRVRSDFTQQQIEAMTDSEAWNWVYAHDQQQKAEMAPKRQQICFTGFSTRERAELEAQAESLLDMEIKSSVTRGLLYLCIGPDAGPAKVAKAQEQGVTVLSREQFSALCETGEVPN
jgi:NAD-dependent DNA ligase